VLPARMLRDKGVVEFVHAARKLRGTARFVLVGGLDTENRAGLSEVEIQRFVNEGVVEWWGHRLDMPEAYAQASLVVLPSYSEGFPLALAEAQAAGRPVVTTDAPGCREAIEPGVTGVLVPLRDGDALATAILSLLGDRPQMEAMALAARHFAERALGLERILDETLAACRLAGADL
jgi:glycosyltransferase involved in cell wall biosynthesis